MTFENELTDEFIKENFKDVQMTFEHYYKYTFTFIGYLSRKVVNGTEYKIVARYGGDHDDVYRFEVDTHKPERFGEMGLDSYSFVEIFKYDDTYPPTYYRKVYEFNGW
jgi:hypothetical protein